MHTRLYFIHAISALHAGTGQGVGVIDLPIARERPTGLPIVPGSTIKGVKRDAAGLGAKTIAIYGPETDNAADHAGAIVFSDARLLCLPVRSYVGTFAWVSCPLVLSRFQRDLGTTQGAIQFGGSSAILVPQGSELVHNGTVVLEDLDLPAQQETQANGPVAEWGNAIASRVFPKDATWRRLFGARFAILRDDEFKFLYETALEVTARIRIDADTRTVADGALWYEEALPAESILWGLAGADKPRAKESSLKTEADVLNTALPVGVESILQLGGKATVGRGRVRLLAA